MNMEVEERVEEEEEEKRSLKKQGVRNTSNKWWEKKRKEDGREIGELKETDTGMEKKNVLEVESVGEKWNKKD